MLHLLPGLWRAPVRQAGLVIPIRPLLREIAVAEDVGASVHRVAIAVDGDAMDFSIPGADRRLEVIDDVVEVDLRLHPVRHVGEQVLDAHVALERRAHLDDVEVDCAGRDRLLKARVVVGLREVDPLDLRPSIGLPWREEAAEQKVVQVLVVEAHEGEFNAGEFAGLHVGLRRTETQCANLLPVGVGRRAIACAGNLHDLRDDAVFSKGRRRRQDGRACGQRCGAGRAFQDIPPASLHRHKRFVDVHTHGLFLPIAPRVAPDPSPDAARRCARTRPALKLTQEAKTKRALRGKSIAGGLGICPHNAKRHTQVRENAAPTFHPKFDARLAGGSGIPFVL